MTLSHRAKDFLLGAGLAIPVWVAKFLALALPTSSPALFPAGLLFAILALNACVAAGLLYPFCVPKLGLRGLWKERGLWRVCGLTTFGLLPLAPDTYAAFRSEAAVGFALLCVALCYVFTWVLVVAVRVLALWLAELMAGAIPRVVAGCHVLLLMVFLHVCEALLLFGMPVVYWAALPLPVLLPQNTALPIADLPQRAAGVEPVALGVTEAIVLVGLDLADSERQEIYEGGDQRIVAQAEVLAAKLTTPQFSSLRLQSLVIVFPETTFFLDERQFGLFYTRLDALLREFFLRDPVDPYGQQQATTSRTFNLRLYLGAQDGDANVVFQGVPHPLSGRPVWSLAKEKRAPVPFFERPVMGLSLRATNSTSELAPPLTLTPVPTTSPLPIRVGAPALGTKVPFAVSLDSLAICYDALDVTQWHWRAPRVVLTNHTVFSRFTLASRLYDYNLRLIAFAFQAPLVLVANKGATGAYFATSDRLELAGEGQSTPHTPALQALFLHLQGL